jgi:hypothetical protein
VEIVSLLYNFSTSQCLDYILGVPESEILVIALGWNLLWRSEGSLIYNSSTSQCLDYILGISETDILMIALRDICIACCHLCT